MLIYKEYCCIRNIAVVLQELQLLTAHVLSSLSCQNFPGEDLSSVSFLYFLLQYALLAVMGAYVLLKRES